MLKDFKGVLHRFHAAYDAIPCPSRSLIHLIRDLNDDVMKHPYDEELKGSHWRGSAQTTVETDRYGPCRYLRKTVDRRSILSADLDVPPQSEIAIKVMNG